MPDLFENLRGLDVRVRVLDVATPTPSRAVIPDSPERAHSPDFASVVWNGRRFALTPNQRAVVNVLWHA